MRNEGASKYGREIPDPQERTGEETSSQDRSARTPQPEELTSKAFLHKLLDNIPQMVWCSRPDGTLIYVNQQWLEYSGLTLEQTQNGGWTDFIHPDDAPAMLEQWRSSARRGATKDFQIEVRFKRASDASYHWHLLRAAPERGTDGTVSSWYGTATNIDEQRVVTEGLAFLNAAGELLSGSLDYYQTLRSLTELAVPRIADWAAIDMLTDDGKIERLAIRHVDPKMVDLAREFMERYPPEHGAGDAVWEVIRTGEPLMVEEITDEQLVKSAVDDEYLRMIRKLGLVAVLVVPITVRGRNIGAITLALSEARRKYTQNDKRLAIELARRASLAIENAELYQASRQELEERHRIERELSEHERGFRTFVESNIIGILFSDRQGVIHSANKAFLDMLGYTREEIETGHISRDLITAPEFRGLYHAAVEEIDRTGTAAPYSKQFVRKDGSRIDVLLGTVVLEDEPDRVVSFVLNETKRREAERAREEAEERYRLLAESATDSIITIDEHNIVRFANPATEKIFGFKPEEMVGESLDVIIPEHLRQLHEAGMKRYITTGTKHMDWSSVSVIARHKDGHDVPIDISFGEYELNGRHVFTGILRDISEKQRTEAELRLAKASADEALETAEQANKAKDQFLAILSHELRTPLTPIMATVQAMQLEEELPPDTRAFVDIIARNVELEARLIDDLLDHTRILNGKLTLHCEHVDLHTTLNEVMEMYMKEALMKKLHVRVRMNAQRHVVNADPARLQQVFWNLIKNAIKFTAEGGTLTITTENVGERVKVCVADTGIGIEPTMLARLFNPFEQGEKTITRKFGGLGLGLAISKNLVEMHEGKLSVESGGKDKGATFVVELKPLDVVDNQIEIKPQPSIPAVTQKTRILLVDDNMDTGNVLKTLLERRGYDVCVASDVRHALTNARKWKFDLLISDIGLPDGTGMDIVRELRKEMPVRAIAMSGYGTDRDVEEAKAAGFEKHFTKPFNFAELFAEIERMVS